MCKNKHISCLIIILPGFTWTLYLLQNLEQTRKVIAKYLYEQWAPICWTKLSSIVLLCVLDSGREETAEGRREAQTGLHQAWVSAGGVEMEEWVSLTFIITFQPLFGLHDVCHIELSAFIPVCPRKGEEIYHQLRRLGASLDWSRACFTMDPVRL